MNVMENNHHQLGRRYDQTISEEDAAQLALSVGALNTNEQFSTYKPIRNHNNMAIDDFYQQLIRQSNTLSINTFRNDLMQHQVRSRAEASRQPQQPVIVNQILPGEEGRFLSTFLKQPYALPDHGLAENTTLAEIELATAAANNRQPYASNSMYVPPPIVPKSNGDIEVSKDNHEDVQSKKLERKRKSKRNKNDINLSTNGQSEHSNQICMSLRESELEKIVDKSNPLVFLAIDIDGQSVGTIIIELFNHVVPKTSENFRQLCTGENGFGYHMSYFHRIIPGFVCQGGDFERSDGTGGCSIYGAEFEDESFTMTHNRPFLLSMANCGKNTNGSQFFITLMPCSHLDGKHVVFGHVIKGLKTIKEIEKCGTDSGEITKEVKVVNCGQVE